jgi:hypothetical protein
MADKSRQYNDLPILHAPVCLFSRPKFAELPLPEYFYSNIKYNIIKINTIKFKNNNIYNNIIYKDSLYKYNINLFHQDVPSHD